VPRQLLRERAVARVHALGPRVPVELIDEIIRHHPDLEEEIDRRIDKYRDLDPEFLRLLGADKFPAGPLRIIGPDR
jgi:hypothetical protein